MGGWRDNIEQDPRVRNKVPAPAGYKSTEEFLSEMRTRHSDGRTADEHNERAGRDDARFVIGEQWDKDVERRRKAKNKPVLTFDRMQAFVAQVVNNRLMNETEIRVFPDKSGTKAIAELRQGIIRSIYKNSMADYARDEAMKYQVIGGQGGFCLSIDYVSDDVFEQEIHIKPLMDPYSIVLDPDGGDPTGGDAQWGFVEDDVPIELFKERYPWAGTESIEQGFSEGSSVSDWLTQDHVRVVSYWRMVQEGTRLLALYQDGAVHDVTDMEDYEFLPFVTVRPDGTPFLREVPDRFARMYLCSGRDILEGPFDYKMSSLPIYRVSGWEVTDGEKLHRWGLVRKMKDPLRLHNYARSVQAEQLVATPRNKYLTTQQAIKGYETRWRNAATSDDPFLFYVDGETPPEHVPPPPIDPNLLAAAEQTMQDLRDISNIHEASLGAPSNEVSKVAIQARQSVSDVGTFIYHDRLRMADERCAKNINELIPYIYDTERLLPIVDQDDKHIVAAINSPQDPNSDVTLGKYGVTVTVGPSTVTKRQLAAEQMMAFVNAMPEQAGGVMDLVAEAQDWPKADEFARRFRLGLPDGFVPDDELSPEQQQARQGAQQVAQLQQQLEQREAEAEIAKKENDAVLSEKRAIEAEARAYKAIADAQSRIADVQGKNKERGVNQALDMINQHNTLEAEDRDFDTRREDVARQIS